MASLRDIRSRIRGVKNIRQVTKAMNMIAAARLRRGQQKAESARPYADRLASILNDVISSSGGVASHPLMLKREVRQVALILITADRGLCGAFNAGMIREAQRFLNEQPHPISLITVGRKGRDYFQRREIPIAQHFSQPSRDVPLEEIGSISKQIISDYSSAQFDEVHLGYSKFASVLRAEPTIVQLLPFAKPQGNDTKSSTAFQFEPAAELLLDTLLPQYVEVLIYRALVESIASEQAARMIAMKAATDSASDMIQGLTRQYNTARQASITKQILEVISGADALEVEK